jgi:hypothetical protein
VVDLAYCNGTISQMFTPLGAPVQFDIQGWNVSADSAGKLWLEAPGAAGFGQTFYFDFDFTAGDSPPAGFFAQIQGCPGGYCSSHGSIGWSQTWGQLAYLVSGEHTGPVWQQSTCEGKFFPNWECYACPGRYCNQSPVPTNYYWWTYGPYGGGNNSYVGQPTILQNADYGGNGEGDAFTCMDVWGGAGYINAGAKIDEWYCTGAANQLFGLTIPGFPN